MQTTRTWFAHASLGSRTLAVPSLCAVWMLVWMGCAPKQVSSVTPAAPPVATTEPAAAVNVEPVTATSEAAVTHAPAIAASPYTDRGASATLESQIQAGATSLLAHVEVSSGKKAIMRTVSHSLGVQCDYCHDVADFGAPSTNKTVADYMLTHFSDQLVNKDGSVLTCNGCHQGQVKFLGDRADKKRVKELMKTRFVEGLRTKEGGAVKCATCHGSPFVPEFLPKGPKAG